MKKLMPVLFSLIVLSCNDKQDTKLPVNEVLCSDDISATAGMRTDLGNMQLSLDSRLLTAHHTHQLHWDSLYHHHDSLFWHHHNLFHHDHYTHDDHHHTWTDYDPHIDHNHHYHHPFPGHVHDSLVTTHNAHEHNNDDHHYTGHDLHDHHVLDSLHAAHGPHHP